MKKILKRELTLLLAMLSVLILVCSSCSGKQVVLKDGKIAMLNDSTYSVPAAQLMELMECCDICTSEVK